MLALSGNAAAMIMNDDGSKMMEFSDYDKTFIQEVIEGKYDIAQWVVNKVDKKYRKHGVKVAKLETATLGRKQAKHLSRKITRKETKIAKFLSKVGVETLALNITDECCNGEQGNGEQGNGEQGNGEHSVPEPSTIALLGLGLVGIGAARRLRKKAR